LDARGECTLIRRSRHVKLLKTNAGEVAERLKAAVC
jgi:hypothetical protein